MNEICGVILAAGKGSRLYPITETIPKPLVPIGDQALIEYQLDILKQLDIKKCYIVIGHFGFEIAKHLGNGHKYGVKIEYVEQKEPLGIANALTYTSRLVGDRFLLMLGDIFFEIDNLHSMMRLMDERKANGVLATKAEKDPEAIKRNFAVLFDDDGRVRRVVEKPAILENDIKGCGMYLFDRNIFEAVNRTPRTALRNEYELTDSIQIFIDLGYKVYYDNVISDDLNITFIQDLFEINMNYLHRNSINEAIGHNVELGQKVSLNNVVIGNDVVIEDDVILTDSLVLADVHIKSGSRIRNSIVTRNNILKL